jgi:hypothetical protein
MLGSVYNKNNSTARMRKDLFSSMEESQKINVQEWCQRGSRLWEAVKRDKIVILPWKNPCLRLASVSVVLFLASLLVWFILPLAIAVAVMGVLIASALFPLFYAIKFYLIGQKTGGLYSFFSEEGFGVGCSQDRVFIPYSALRFPEEISPSTVNENYIVLPVTPLCLGAVIEKKSGPAANWDGTPYTRGIITVLKEGDKLIARAYPNEMIVHLFCAIYPLCFHLLSPPNSRPNLP